MHGTQHCLLEYVMIHFVLEYFPPPGGSLVRSLFKDAGNSSVTAHIAMSFKSSGKLLQLSVQGIMLFKQGLGVKSSSANKIFSTFNVILIHAVDK